MVPAKSLRDYCILCVVLSIGLTECRTLRRWNKNLIYWKFSDPYNLLSSKQFESVRKIIAETFDEWKYALDGLVKFEEKTNDHMADINVFFAKRNHSCYEDFDGRGGVVAHSMYPPFGILHLDGDEIWKTKKDQSENSTDIRQVILHEIGHTLGLRHSNQRLSVMRKYYEFEKDNGKIMLSKYDVRTIRRLYGGI